jgi:hypothetical protein
MKKPLLVILSLIVVIFIVPGCSKKKGCMDSASVNYDPEAEEDDGSCKYAGCMDTAATNYDPDATQDDGSCTYNAGTGGEATIVAFPKHHGMSIGFDTTYVDSAFIKFNTQNFPGTDPANYDLIIAGEPGETHVHLEGLKRGNYYIYMTGWDTTISQRVTGGIPYTLTITSGEVDLNVPVTE